MLERYREVLNSVRRPLRSEIVRYMVEQGLVPGHAPGRGFYDALERAGVAQADLVLCALRLNTDASLRLAERLMGKPILRCPPMLMRWTSPVKATVRQGDDRRVIAVSKPRARDGGRRRILCADLYSRIGRARVGMTVSGLIGRGLRRRDIRIALKRGYLELSA